MLPRTGRVLWWKDRERNMGLSFACHPAEAPASRLMHSYGLDSRNARRRYASKYWRQLDRELARAAEAETAIFSEEGLSNFDGEDKVANLAEAFRRRFETVKIYCMIREPFSWLSSNYVQYVKMGGTQPWEAYRDDQLDRGLFLTDLAPWLSIFGDKAVRIDVVRTDAVTQFCEFLGLDSPAKAAPRRNVSISQQGVEQLVALNRAYSESGAKRPAAVRKAFEKHMKGPSWRAPKDDISVVYARSQAEIGELLQHDSVSEEGKDFIASRWSPDAVTSGYQERQSDPEQQSEAFTNLLKDLFDK